MAGGILLFNRNAVGIKGNQMWMDNQMFINISHGIAELVGKSNKAVQDLPVDTVGASGKTDNSGTARLKKELKLNIETAAKIARELSDACAVLGSGAEGAVEDMDAAERTVTADFNFVMSSKGKPV